MADVLSQVPGLAGVLAARDRNRREVVDEIQQAGLLQKLQQGVLQARRDAAFRDAMGAAKTDEERTAAALLNASPDKVISHADTRARIDSNKEVAMARLFQSAQQAAAELAVKERNAKTKEELVDVERKKVALRAWFDGERIGILRGEKAYTLPPGFLPQATPQPVVAQAPVQAPATHPGPAPTPTPIPVPVQTREWQEVAPAANAEEAAAIQKIKEASARGEKLTIPIEEEAKPAFPSHVGKYIPPQDPDTELRRLGSQAPAPQPQAAAPAPAEVVVPKKPEMPAFTGSPKQISDAQNKWRAAQARGDVVTLTPDALDLRAHQYLSGQPQAMANLGRGAQGDARILQITNRAAEILKERGGSPQEIGRRMAEFRANSASLNALTKSYDAVVAFEQTAVRNGEILMKLADRVDATGIPVVEKWIRAGRQATGDPDVAEFNAQLQVYRTEAARILTNPNLSGTLTDTARKEIEEFLKGGSSAPQIRRVVTLLKTDFDNRKQTLENQINAARDRLQRNVGPGDAAPPAPAAPSTPAPTGGSREGEKGTSKSGKPMTFRSGRWTYDQ